MVLFHFSFFFYLPEDHGILVDALLALQRVQRRDGAGAIAGDPAWGRPELRREAPGVRGRGRRANSARLPLGLRGRPPRDAEGSEHTEKAVEEVLHAQAAAAAAPFHFPCSCSWPRGAGGDHDDARGDGDRDQALVLPSAAARPPTAGARPAPRGGLHHAPAADPRPAPRAAPARRLVPAPGAGDSAG